MLTREELRESLTELLGEPVEAHDNLIELGMDSIQLMGLTGRLRRLGVEIGFAELARRPTLAEWWELLAERGVLAPAPVPGSGRDPIPGSEREVVEPGESFPLALMQHAYWIGRDSGQPLGSVAAHLYVEFDGRRIDPDRLADRRPGTRRAASDAADPVRDDGIQRPAGPAGPPGHGGRSARRCRSRTGLERLRDASFHQLLPIEDGQVSTHAVPAAAGAAPAAPGHRHARGRRDELPHAAGRPRGDVRGRDLPPIGYSYARYLAADPRPEPAQTECDRKWWGERLSELPGPPRAAAVVPKPNAPSSIASSAITTGWPRRPSGGCSPRRTARGVTPAWRWPRCSRKSSAPGRRPPFLLNVPLFHRSRCTRRSTPAGRRLHRSVLLDVDLAGAATFAERAAAVQAQAARLHCAQRLLRPGGAARPGQAARRAGARPDRLHQRAQPRRAVRARRRGDSFGAPGVDHLPRTAGAAGRPGHRVSAAGCC